jgi:hypothetical protein
MTETLMTERRTHAPARQSNRHKHPDEWPTGDEPMTGGQRAYLKKLSEGAKVPFDDKLTKAQASKRIHQLEEKTGRGKAQQR